MNWVDDYLDRPQPTERCNDRYKGGSSRNVDNNANYRNASVKYRIVNAFDRRNHIVRHVRQSENRAVKRSYLAPPVPLQRFLIAGGNRDAP